MDAGRRRKPTAAPSGGRPRAEAPRRETYGGSSGTGGGTSSGGRTGLRLPTSRGGRSGCSTIVVVIIIAAIYLFQNFGGSESDGGSILPPATTPGGYTDGQIANVAPAAGFATNYPAVSEASPSKAGQTWLVMLYQDADDKVLEEDIYLDLNEAEKAGSSQRVTVVSQIDRYNGAYGGDGNWTGTKRFLINQDSDLGSLGSLEVADVREANMSSGDTLVDYVMWAMDSYPADKYVLILSDHGMGWPGGWTDPAPGGGSDTSTPLQSRLSDHLYLNELDAALGDIRASTGLDKFEVIGLDACLMGQLEVFTALAPHARYAVASEETEPALGWAYTDFLRSLNENPDMGGAELSQAIVQSYIEDDETILDSSARADFLSQGSPFGGLFGSAADASPQQLAREIGQTSTLAAVDLSLIDELNGTLNEFAYALQNGDQRMLASGRSYAQNFTSIFGSDVPPSYIDLGNFVQIVRQNSGGEIASTADAVLAAIDESVIAEKHGRQKAGATGVAIYFPNSELYGNPLSGAQSYTAIANRFAVTSLWDDFMAFHYSGRKFSRGDAQLVVPSSSSVQSPAAGGIRVSALDASSLEVAPGGTVTLTADISGENIGHIYLFVGYYDQSSNSIFVADQDYLESAESRLVDGVYYPDWGEGDFTLRFEWEPVVFGMSDGGTLVPSLFKPEDYGRAAEEAIYAVDGIYTFADSGERLQARLLFIDGVMRQVFGFTGESEASAPREITPVSGDRFTVMEEWLDLNSSGQVTGRSLEEGTILTFGSQMFTWETMDAAAGDYVVGFVVEDLDGNQQQALLQIAVT
ncbi:MAG: clostripain-related cysteine peptidase [Dehalococcoidia bacterium]|nr:clostripain-related cysteine peptidase [Dehalococcoidia bacterium]